MAYIAGVDEAGRGPVIGPMVMCAFACVDESAVKRVGAADSKLLTPQRRDIVARDLRAAPNCAYELIELSPQEIDSAVNGKSSGDSLNKLEVRATALLLYRLAKRVPIAEVIIDSPTRSTEKYEEELRHALNALDKEGTTKKIILRAEIKADANHPVVGAASVLAKTTRDERIQALVAKHGPLGSGYPADPDTQAYLASHWKEGHEFFRKSWESYKRLANGVGQSSLDAFGTNTQSAAKQEEHAPVVKEFEVLREHGFSFVPPTNQYEVVRMKNSGGVTIIRYTTGKLIVQGAQSASTQKLLDSLGLMPLAAKSGASSGADAARSRGRPRKN